MTYAQQGYINLMKNTEKTNKTKKQKYTLKNKGA